MIRSKSILASLFILLYSVSFAQKQPYHIIAYYTGNGEVINQYPVEQLTHIIYSFLKIQNDTLTFKSPKQEESLIQLVELKKRNPELKIMVSVGGWGGCAPCSDLFASEAHRSTFAKTTVALFKKYHVDGIDLDWEYPTIAGYPGHNYAPEDKNNFTELVKTLRQEMGPGYILSFAAGGFTRFLEESVDWDALMPYLDFVNLMTYDLTSGASKTTGHHTPLNNNNTQKQSASNCLNWLIQHKVPASKLVMGAAFYARVWEEVADIDHGLYQAGKFKQGVSYKNADTFFTSTPGYHYYFDKKAKAPYRYNAAQKMFATFDDERSLKAKTAFIRKHHLGGIMFWELSQDKPVNGLVSVIYKNLNGR
ncbi:MAG: glycoside hydrolase family 18 protein [Saprospiraceae bacterium]